MNIANAHKRHIGKGADTTPDDVVHACIARKGAFFVCGIRPYDDVRVWKKQNDIYRNETGRTRDNWVWGQVGWDDVPLVTRQHLLDAVEDIRHWMRGVV